MKGLVFDPYNNNFSTETILSAQTSTPVSDGDQIMVNYLDFNDGIFGFNLSKFDTIGNFHQIQYVEVDALKTWEGAFDGDVEKELIVVDTAVNPPSMPEIDELVLETNGNTVVKVTNHRQQWKAILRWWETTITLTSHIFKMGLLKFLTIMWLVPIMAM